MKSGNHPKNRQDYAHSSIIFFAPLAATAALRCIRCVLCGPGIDWAERCATSSGVTVNFKVGNEKLVKVLEGASAHLRGLLERQGRPDGALRIAVIGGGCSGLQYKMDLVDGPRDRDIQVASNGVNVVIDPKSALFVSGSELDWSDDLQQGGFKVSNPNALVTCSCGESFAA